MPDGLRPPLPYSMLNSECGSGQVWSRSSVWMDASTHTPPAEDSGKPMAAGVDGVECEVWSCWSIIHPLSAAANPWLHGRIASVLL